MGRPVTPIGDSRAALPHDLPARIVDGSPDAILICDRAGTVVYWNTAAERIFGFGVTEALGVSIDLIIPERLRARHWAGWDATMRTGVTRYGEGQLLAVPALHKDGRQLSIEFSIQLVKDADGQIEWVVAVIRDVTERFTRDKDLRAQLKVLQAKATDQQYRMSAEDLDTAANEQCEKDKIECVREANAQGKAEVLPTIRRTCRDALLPIDRAARRPTQPEAAPKIHGIWLVIRNWSWVSFVATDPGGQNLTWPFAQFSRAVQSSVPAASLSTHQVNLPFVDLTPAAG